MVELYSSVCFLSGRRAECAGNSWGSFGSHYGEKGVSFVQHRDPVTHIISMISNQHYYYESFSDKAHSPGLNPLKTPSEDTHQHGRQHARYWSDGWGNYWKVLPLVFNMGYLSGNLLASIRTKKWVLMNSNSSLIESIANPFMEVKKNNRSSECFSVLIVPLV